MSAVSATHLSCVISTSESGLRIRKKNIQSKYLEEHIYGTTLSQLRFGQYIALKAYRSNKGLSSDLSCPKCGTEHLYTTSHLFKRVPHHMKLIVRELYYSPFGADCFMSYTYSFRPIPPLPPTSLAIARVTTGGTLPTDAGFP